MDTPLFSIIIPVYNGEKYIVTCLNSVMCQTLKDWELILIDDGSTDKTPKLLSNYVNKNIHLISKSNEGVSVARNKGLDMAKGEYILFVDADDILYPDALSTLYDSLGNREIDYLRYEYQTIDEKGNTLYPNYEAKIRRKVSDQTLDAAQCITHIVRNEYFLWSGIFRKEIIDKYHLRFMEGCTYNEDTLFMIKFFMHSKTHAYIPKTLYGYRKFDGSVTAKFTEKNYNDVRAVFSELCEIYNDKDSDFQKALKNVIERIGLRLYIKKEYFNLKNPKDKSVFDFCIISPILLEWKLISIFGLNIAVKSFPLINFARKIIRRIA